MLKQNPGLYCPVPRADNEQVVSRSHETAALRAIQNLDFDVPTIYYDEKSGIKITEFIPDCQEYEPCTAQDEKLNRSAGCSENSIEGRLTLPFASIRA